MGEGLYNRSLVHSGQQGFIDYVTRRIKQIDKTHVVRVGIDGVDASGKTTLADSVCNVLSTDNFWKR